MVSAATYATGNMGSPVSSAYMTNTLTAHISIVRGALLFWVHIRGGCNSDQLPSLNISNQVQAVPEEVQEPEICKPFPGFKVSGDTQGVEVSMEEGTAEYLCGENGQDLRAMFLLSKFKPVQSWRKRYVTFVSANLCNNSRIIG